MNILFIAQRNLHVPHLLPINDWLSHSSGVEVTISWTSPNYVPSIRNNPGAGLDNETRRELKERGVNWIPPYRIASMKPELAVVADAFVIPELKSRGVRFVNVNHGLISKGWFYTNSPRVRRESDFDLICVPGRYHRNMLKKYLDTEILASGVVKLDRVFNGELKRDQILEKWGIDPAKKVVLFAPTYNPELSGVPIVTDDVRRWATEGLEVIIKLHGMSPPEWVDLYKYISLVEPNIHLIDELDITPSLVAANVVVSDVSSAFIEAVALNRPVVLINNPGRIRYPMFDPRDIEYLYRDVGEEVEKREDVLPAILREIEKPEHRFLQRTNAAGDLAGPVDGRASERIGKAILKLRRLA